jgi:hypothetical protein
MSGHESPASLDQGEVLVSRTLTELVAGSGIEFVDHGEHQLKGVPGAWRLFAMIPKTPSSSHHCELAQDVRIPSLRHSRIRYALPDHSRSCCGGPFRRDVLQPSSDGACRRSGSPVGLIPLASYRRAYCSEADMLSTPGTSVIRALLAYSTSMRVAPLTAITSRR